MDEPSARDERTRAGRRLRPTTLGAALALLLLVGVLMGPLLAAERGVPFEEAFIFFPSRTLVATPADVGLPYEEVWFGEGTNLHGWFVPGPADVTLLWFQGNAGNLSDRVHLMRRLRDGLGTSLFIFGYQGYGLSHGRPSEAATRADARAALAYLHGRGDVHPERIVYYGKSLGAAVALELATAAPPYRLVAQSAFTSIADMARLHYPFLPVGGLLRTRFPNLERIRHVAAPVLVIHGDRDEVTPVEHGRALFAAATEPKRLFVVEGARHDDVIAVGGRAYLDVLREFIGPDRPERS